MEFQGRIEKENRTLATERFQTLIQGQGKNKQIFVVNKYIDTLSINKYNIF